MLLLFLVFLDRCACRGLHRVRASSSASLWHNIELSLLVVEFFRVIVAISVFAAAFMLLFFLQRVVAFSLSHLSPLSQLLVSVFSVA